MHDLVSITFTEPPDGIGVGVKIATASAVGYVLLALALLIAAGYAVELAAALYRAGFRLALVRRRAKAVAREKTRLEVAARLWGAQRPVPRAPR